MQENCPCGLERVTQMILGAALITSGVGLELATFGGYTIGFAAQEALGASLIVTGMATTIHQSRDLAFPTSINSFSGYNTLYNTKTEPASTESTQPEVNDNEDKKTKNKKDNGKRHTPDQEALNEIAKKAKKTGVTNSEADILLQWAKEYNFNPQRDDRGINHWQNPPKEHIHVGDHILIKP
jgi:hypothetical protein